MREPNGPQWDQYVARLIETEGFGTESHYFGITSLERAEDVRAHFRTAGRHLQVSVKAYWGECDGCERGGRECRYHVYFTAYRPEEASAYMKAKAASLKWRPQAP